LDNANIFILIVANFIGILMGILEAIIQKPVRKEKSVEVCIPDHAKPNRPKQVVSTFPSSFEVDGVYELHKKITISGKVVSGAITKNSKLNYHGTAVLLNELICQGKTVDSLEKGDCGAITIIPEFFLRIENKSILEFE